jgi:AmmeMemoRadiSam system protein B
LVDDFVTEARQRQPLGPPKAVIAPHAGYVYSGPIAGTAYSYLREGHPHIDRVVLMGPAHRVAFSGVAASPADAFATPLGDVRVDRDVIAQLLRERLIVEHAAAHRDEHSLEVHLPFVQRLYPNAQVIPLLVGDADFRGPQEILERLWGAETTIVVISSDLSHYHDYETARRMDSDTAKMIEALEPTIDWDQACGATPVNALLGAAVAKGLRAHTVDLRNSGDTAGPRNEVVGYGAFVFV